MTTRGGGPIRAVAVVAALIAVAFLTCFAVWPLVALTARATFAPAAGLGGLTAADIGEAAAMTVGLAAAGTALALALGLPAAWGIVRMGGNTGRAVSAFLTAPFALPTVVVALAFAALSRDYLPALRAAHGAPGVVAALAFFNIAVVVRAVVPALEATDARLAVSARVLGAGPVRTAWHVTWPAIRGAVRGAALLTFLFCSSSLALVLVLGGSRLRTLEAATLLEATTFFNLPGAAVLGLVQAAIVVVATIAVRPWNGRRRGAAPTAIPVHAGARRGWWGILGAAPALVWVTVPLGALIGAALDLRGGASLRAFAALATPGVAGPGSPSLLDAAAASCRLAVIATAITVAVAVASVVGSRLSAFRWLPGFAHIPLAISPVALGLGLLVGWSAAAARLSDAGHIALLAIAQSLVAVPLVLRVTNPAIDAIKPGLIHAATSLGAGPGQVLRHVIWPSVRGAAWSGLGLAFAVALGEFGASSFLVRPGVPTLPTVIIRLLGHPGADSAAIAAAGALVLAVLTGGIMLLTEFAGRARRVAG